jgi:hypothetical protein
MEGVLLEVLHEQMSDKATAGVCDGRKFDRFLNSLERQRRCDNRADDRFVKIVEYILQHEVCLHRPYV